MITVTNIGPKQARIFDIKFKKHPSAFVRVHHPSCGHCLDMEPELKKLHKILQSDYKGDIGIFDIHADAVSEITTPALKSINGYPTVMVIKDDKQTLYNGDRSSDDMLNFCLKHLNLEKILKVYEGKKKKSRKLRCPKKHSCACPNVRCSIALEYPGCEKITKCDRKWRRKYKKGGKTKKRNIRKRKTRNHKRRRSSKR